MGSGLSAFNVFSQGTSCGPYNPFVGHRIEKIDSVTIQSASPTNLLRNESKKHNFDSHETAGEKPVEKVKETNVDKNLHLETKEQKKYDSESDEDEEERRNSDFEGYVYMKSPSFRDFFAGYHSDDSVNPRLKRTATIGKIDVEKEKKIKPAGGSNIIPPDIVCDGEVCMRRPPEAANSSSSTSTACNKMRRKRRSSFSKLFVHPPTGMKNLFKVKDYYSTPQPQTKKTTPQN